MKITVQSTQWLISVDGAETRAWHGQTESGVPVTAFIARLAVDERDDFTQFERELSETREPSLVLNLGVSDEDIALLRGLESSTPPGSPVRAALGRLLDAVAVLTGREQIEEEDTEIRGFNPNEN